MYNPTGNGDQDQGGIGNEARERLQGVGRSDRRYGNAHTNGDGPKARKTGEPTEPPHSLRRHPEDPPGAYEGAAREVADPEEIRVLAVILGKASQALDPQWFEWFARALYRCIHDVRIGAITGPGKRAAGDQMKVAASTEAAIGAIQKEAIGDEAKAKRLETSAIPRAERELAAAEIEVEKCEGKADRAQEEVARRRPEEEAKRAREKNEPPPPSLWARLRRSAPNLFTRVELSPWKASLAFVVEVVGGAYLLAPNIADIANTSYVTGLLISAVISITMLTAAFAAGTGLAAIRLPGWTIGLALLTAFGGLLVQFIPALDALRVANPSGIETLTAATLAALLIAMVTGYALATSEDSRRAIEVEEREDEPLRRAGSPLGEALDRLVERRAELEAAKKEVVRCKTLMRALWDKVESLEDAAARADAIAEKRRQAGIEAEVEVETIGATVEVGIEQEEAAAEWAYLISLAAKEKAWVEELPDPGASSAVTPPPANPTEPRSGLSVLRKLALAVAAISGIASLWLGPIALGIGIPVAALLAALEFRPRGRDGDSEAGRAVPPVDQHPTVVAAADGDNPLYRYQPDHMVPKYDDGGADAGQHQ
jgi:hypothetical protein